MKPLGNNGFNPALKVATGLVLIFILSGTLFSVWHGIRKVGFRPQTAQVYYLGSGEELSYPKELSELLESTHVHLFMIPLIYYVLCHLFAQTSLSAFWKTALIGLTFTNIAVFLLTPYLIRFVSPVFAMLIPLHHVVFAATAVLLTLFPIREALLQ
jgi:hypothetical protein